MYLSMQQAGSSEKFHQFLGFTRTEAVLADLFDAIQENTIVTLAPNLKKGSKPPKLVPYPGRPKKDDPEKKKATVADLFGRFRSKGAPLYVNNNR